MYSDWIITMFTDEPPKFDKLKMNYMIFQREECPTTKKKHWHAFVQFNCRKRFSTLKRLWPTARIEQRQGTVEQAIAYCSKEESRISSPEEYGTPDMKTKQGKRNDIEAFRQAIERGDTEKQIAMDHFGTWCRYGNLIPKYRQLQQISTSQYLIESFKRPPLDLSKKHWLIYGDPDTGKTQYALSHFKKPLYVRHRDTLALWDGHDGIVIDEMNFAHWPINAVIGLLNRKDPQQIHVRYKVAYIPAGIPIIFTSNEENIFYDVNSPPSASCIKSIAAKVNRLHVLNKLF